MRGCSCFLKSSIISRMSSWTPDAVPDEEMKKNNFLFVTYTIIQSITSSEICALQPIQVQTHLEQWAANAAAPREQLGVRCLAQGSYLSRGQFLPEPRFEPTTLGYKSDALSIRPRLPHGRDGGGPCFWWAGLDKWVHSLHMVFVTATAALVHSKKGLSPKIHFMW